MGHPNKASIDVAHKMLKSVGLSGPQSLLNTNDEQEQKNKKRRNDYVTRDSMGVTILPDDERERKIRGY